MQQSHSSPHEDSIQGPNTSEADSNDDITTSIHESRSQPLFLSNTIGFLPPSSQYPAIDMQIQDQYGQQNVYYQDFSQNYPSHAHNQLPFPLVQGSSSDVINYTLGQLNKPGQSNLRRASLPPQPGPIREHPLTLSHYRGNEPAGPPLSAFTSQPYSRDHRNPGAHQMHPPTAYRPLPSQAIHQQPPVSHASHPPSSHLDTSVPYQARRSSVPSLLPTHLLREMPVSATQPSFQQAGASPPSPSESQPRPFVCEICGLGFVRGHDLKRHRDTHSSVRPHVCECGRSFSRRDALRRHIFLKSCPCDKTWSGDATAED